MKPAEIREMTLAELEERIDAERDRLHRLKMTHAVSPLENPEEMRKIKKDIARMLTILTERRRNAE
ncbi:MAG: 50S ribosomal protein L29 [Candidatus [Bacteroides] periocalifornicus]|jgi:ribosomal protein L29|uniref:Large ribosomal subunit protein uL29 n=1 Tax=Candidatus [Bacteroides] periocalifornicus TaxID=1702214 RepID=A0A0Q4B8E9_9BACT|nr:MAG: 50S ribosomal protein L29 [Candidatus [Bacteroides] periocalifornicus]MBB1572929.1 50S ribosomal protein L29 [Bacteroidia bacterium]